MGPPTELTLGRQRGEGSSPLIPMLATPLVNKSLIGSYSSAAQTAWASYIQRPQTQGLLEYYAKNRHGRNPLSVITTLSSPCKSPRKHQTAFNITQHGYTNVLQQCSPITFMAILIHWMKLVTSYVVRTASLHCWGTVLKVWVTTQLSHDPLPVHYARYPSESCACVLQVEQSGCGT